MDYKYRVDLTINEKIDVETGLSLFRQYLQAEIKKNPSDSTYCMARRQYLQDLLKDVDKLTQKFQYGVGVSLIEC